MKSGETILFAQMLGDSSTLHIIDPTLPVLEAIQNATDNIRNELRREDPPRQISAAIVLRHCTLGDSPFASVDGKIRLRHPY